MIIHTFSDFNELKDSITDYCLTKHLEKQELLDNDYFFIWKKDTFTMEDINNPIISDDVPRIMLLRFRSIIDDTTWEITVGNFKHTANREQINAFSSQDGRRNFCKMLNELYKCDI